MEELGMFSSLLFVIACRDGKAVVYPFERQANLVDARGRHYLNCWITSETSWISNAVARSTRSAPRGGMKMIFEHLSPAQSTWSLVRYCTSLCSNHETVRGGDKTAIRLSAPGLSLVDATEMVVVLGEIEWRSPGCIRIIFPYLGSGVWRYFTSWMCDVVYHPSRTKR